MRQRLLRRLRQLRELQSAGKPYPSVATVMVALPERGQGYRTLVTGGCEGVTRQRTKVGLRTVAPCDTTQTGNLAFGPDGPRCGGELHRDAEPARAAGGEVEGSVVCLGDAFDDCQAEADTRVVGACAFGPALKRLDKRGSKLWGELLTGVLDCCDPWPTPSGRRTRLNGPDRHRHRR